MKKVYGLCFIWLRKRFFLNKLNFRTRDRGGWSWIFRMIPSFGLETQSIVYTVHWDNCDMFSVSVHCAVCILQYAVCSMLWVLFSVQSVVVSVLYAVVCVLCTESPIHSTAMIVRVHVEILTRQGSPVGSRPSSRQYHQTKSTH